MHRKKIILTLFLALTLSITACTARDNDTSMDENQDVIDNTETDNNDGEDNQEEVKYAEIGKRTPDFQVNSLDGESYSLESMAGKPIYLSFYSVNCGYCIEELPTMSKLHQENSDWANIVSVNVGEAPTYSEELREEHNLKMPILLDENIDMSTSYMVRYVPMNVFIDAQGQVLEMRPGVMETREILDILQSGK